MLNTSVLSIIKVPFLVYIILTLGLFLSGADMALGRFRMMPLPPTVAALLMIISIVSVGLIRDLLNRNAGKNSSWILEANQGPIMAFLCISVVSLLFSGHPTAYWAEKGKWIFLISYGFGIFVCAMFLPLVPEVRKYFRIFPFIALIALVLSMNFDAYNPGYFSTELSRAAGFPGNSNLASVITVLLCSSILSYDLEKNVLSDFLIFSIGIYALILTQSRSGFLEMFILVCFYFYVNFFKRRVGIKRILICFVGVLAAIAILALIAPTVLQNSPMFQQYNTRFSNILTSSQIDDGSSASRMKAAEDSIVLINKSPVLGHGTGYSRRMEELPHNIYLQQWVNNGILGLLSYLALLIIGARVFIKRSYFPGQALLLVAALGGLFSHNMLDQRPFLMLFGMSLALSLPSSGQIQKQSPYNHVRRIQ